MGGDPVLEIPADGLQGATRACAAVADSQGWLPRADNVVLIRLAHQFAFGEDPTLSQPVTVSLTDIFPAAKVRVSQ